MLTHRSLPVNTPARLAFFVPSMRGGGAERVTAILAGAIAARGYAVDLVLAQAEGPNMAAVADAVRIIDFKCSKLLFTLPSLVRYLRQERPAAMLSMMAHTNIVALTACRVANVATRKIVSERVSVSWRKRHRSRKLPWLIAHFYPWADDIIAVSDGVADDLAAATALPREKIRTIYNPIVRPEVQEKAKAPLHHPWFKAGEPPVVLAAGRLIGQKDFSTLIHAFARVRQARPARLLILGEGEDRPALEGLIAALGLTGDIGLPGFAADPYPYMARAAAFVLSSRWEGLPGVLIEALYCGAPLIATDCPSGPKEILQDGRYGRLVPVGDVEVLATAIQSALAGEIAPAPPESWRPYVLDNVVNQYLQVLLGH
ncbi:MAG: glycosyltransferase [Gammaproteobacteria bacterium]